MSGSAKHVTQLRMLMARRALWVRLPSTDTYVYKWFAGSTDPTCAFDYTADAPGWALIKVPGGSAATIIANGCRPSGNRQARGCRPIDGGPEWGHRMGMPETAVHRNLAADYDRPPITWAIVRPRK